MNGTPMLEMQKSSSSSSLVKRRKKRRELERLLNGRLPPFSSNHPRGLSSRGSYELARDESFSDSDNPNNPSASVSATAAQMFAQSSAAAFYASHSTSCCRSHTCWLLYASLLLAISAFVCSAVLLWLFFLSRGDLHRVTQDVIQDMTNRQTLYQELQATTTSFHKLQGRIDELQQNFSHLATTVDSLQRQAQTQQALISKLQETDLTSKQLLSLPTEMANLKETTASLGSSLRDMKSELVEKAIPRVSALENAVQKINVSSSEVERAFLQLFPSGLRAQISNLVMSSNVTGLSHSASNTTQNVVLLSQTHFMALWRALRINGTD